MRMWKSVVPAVVAAFIAIPVWAAPPEMEYEGKGQACFGAECDRFRTNTFAGAGAGAIWFQGQEFDGITVGGGSSFTYGKLHAGSLLGTFDTPISIFLNFSAPTGIDPDPVFAGDVFGGIFLGHFTNGKLMFGGPQTFAFSGPGLPGSFTVKLNDVDLNDEKWWDLDHKVNLTGSITDATVTPEPVSMALLGTGLAGLAAARRRRGKPESTEQDEE